MDQGMDGLEFGFRVIRYRVINLKRLIELSFKTLKKTLSKKQKYFPVENLKNFVNLYRKYSKLLPVTSK